MQNDQQPQQDQSAQPFTGAEPVQPQQPLQQPQPQQPASDPGEVLAIASLVCIVLFPLLGLILGFVARNKSRAVGIDNKMAKIGIIINGILVAFGAVVAVFYLILIILVAGSSSMA